MRNLTFKAGTLVVLLALTGCAQQAHQEAQAQATLSNQSVLALNWFQESGEYQALCYQAFNTARSAFDNASAAPGKKKVVVVDLDETMLDNSLYSGWQVKHDQPFDSKSWAKWIQAKQASAIPGAVQFANYVNSHGGKMVYISNRQQSEFNDTRDNMIKLGFPGVSAQTVLLNTGNSNKQERFNAVKSAGNDIVLYIGDNLNDFGAATYHKENAERREFVRHNQIKFGTQFIVLPNPLYGDWESGMSNGYNKLTPAQKLQVRDRSIQSWSGQ
ncbi:5'-nucleotidase, lipoprotein e(P4) family [Pectobacteriaceae bacterium CE70]|uniref:5'-nucleotidase, lipoprotein e(P4) family n=1 Tax=Serratia sp. (strain ATCC 39006) TaxID=104623 RepID=A0A2I5T6B5_SERS3|nr:5'-nucleotidase, lipoprotein e(P4) family [Serratia sp. ATCC 39006]WJV61317.1 5'-nucleotidase, lipoprotein e(P4) family [Pectobacteriaceae bacterium C52]WJV65645.1 5'-nucleotidase, lipoprotein e(P4) family [Pectobacteriaceae bacterium CE70]WJY09666.1 5'-nucleotidase, lipoprotein e(P4) family [Pectobacteriaceae bacterium C80]AUH00125.1 5'-nucleotidase, lipoprotein e(P4) family [Serratia sp. ATCC 39006]AUH04444.1 5'-nucleotidase, lipoprotein e(P4) family [Serratia sp. ATCC 39006]